jgi:Glycosyltransferase like family 2
MGRTPQPRSKRQADPDPAGTVALLCGELGRWTVGHQCFAALDLPPGSTRRIFSSNVHVPETRNDMMRSSAGAWLAMIDDDQVYQPDLIRRLVRHLRDPRVDIVTPLTLRREPPHLTVLLGPSKNPIDEPFALRQLALRETDTGLLEVEATGTGVMLMRQSVIERVADPWFEFGAAIGEDYQFCMKARAAGCRIFCDLDTRVGHIIPMAVWPHRNADGSHGVKYTRVPSVGSQERVIDIVRRMDGTDPQ